MVSCTVDAIFFNKIILPGLGMSNIYDAEPTPTGKVLFETTYGDVEVELWARECPRSCRHFLQLAMEGYYDGLGFERLVRGFLVQIGQRDHDDMLQVTGIESHSRLKFNRRGLLGFVEAATGDDNQGSTKNKKDCKYGPSFFITLGPTPELDRNCTLFGRVFGDTIFNLMRMNDLETLEGSPETPVYPPTINRLVILTNPFNDIHPRQQFGLKQTKDETGSDPLPKKKRALALSKKSLLSFEEESGDAAHTIRSIHDEDGGNISINAVVSPPLVKEKKKMEDNNVDPWDQIEKERQERLQLLKEQVASAQRALVGQEQGETKEQAKEKTVTSLDSIDRLLGRRPREQPPSHNKESPSNSKIGSLLNSILASECKKTSKASKAPLVGGRKRLGEAAKEEQEVGTLLALNRFREKLSSTAPPDLQLNESAIDKSSPNVLEICRLHGLVGCRSCRDTFGLSKPAGDDEDAGEEGWLMHRLVFDRESGYRSLRQDLDGLQVIDPRERTREIREGNKK